MRMILLTTVILFGLGTSLYQVKTGIDERQDHLRQVELKIANTKRDIAVLESEWAYLSRPERIITLSDQLLGMTPIPQDRVLPLDAIPVRQQGGTTPIDAPVRADQSITKTSATVQP
jgi:hypothetical protein